MSSILVILSLTTLHPQISQKGISVHFYFNIEKRADSIILNLYEHIDNQSYKKWYLTYSSRSKISYSKDSALICLERNSILITNGPLLNWGHDTLTLDLLYLNAIQGESGHSGVHKIIEIPPKKAVLIHYIEVFDVKGSIEPKYIQFFYRLFSEAHDPKDISYQTMQPRIGKFWEKYDPDTYIDGSVVFDNR